MKVEQTWERRDQQVSSSLQTNLQTSHGTTEATESWSPAQQTKHHHGSAS